MAKRSRSEEVPHRSIAPDQNKFDERTSQRHVQSDAGLEYGEVSGFRFGLESTGHRHKLSGLGRKVKD